MVGRLERSPNEKELDSRIRIPSVFKLEGIEAKNFCSGRTERNDLQYCVLERCLAVRQKSIPEISSPETRSLWTVRARRDEGNKANAEGSNKVVKPHNKPAAG